MNKSVHKTPTFIIEPLFRFDIEECLDGLLFFRWQGVKGPDDETVFVRNGRTVVAVAAGVVALLAIHAGPADKDTDGNLEKISHFQQY